MLAGLSKIWSNCSYSNSIPIPGLEHWLLLMPSLEAPVAAHLCPGSTIQWFASSARHLMLPTKPEWFESALSALSILTAYQEDWFGQPLMSRMLSHGRKWQSLLTCPSIPSMSQSRLRARLWWPLSFRNKQLANLNDREWADILDIPKVPRGIFDSALMLMQQRCEAKKKYNKALTLYLPL